MEPEAEATLRGLGERGDIIKRMHRALTERGIERGTASYVLAAESIDVPVIGRLVARGLDDELHGSAYAIVDGVDGRSHHIRLPDLDAAGDGAPAPSSNYEPSTTRTANGASHSRCAPIWTSPIR